MLFGVWVSSGCAQGYGSFVLQDAAWGMDHLGCAQGLVMQDAVWDTGLIRLCTGGSLANWLPRVWVPWVVHSV